MNKLLLFVASLFLLLPASQAAAEEGHGAHALTVAIMNAEGKTIGSAKLTQEADNVRIRVEAEKLTPGVHAIHIHETGKCDPPDFKSAGEHFNPGHTQHGFNNPQGFHAGDLPNITADAEGKVKADITSAVITLLPGKPNSLRKEGGTALIIHEKADDYVTDPAGNAGARIACGVIR